MHGRKALVRVIVGMLVAALAGTAIAAAAKYGHFEGKMEGGGKIHFDTKIGKGKTKQVSADTFTKVPVSCDERNGLLNLQIVPEAGPGIANATQVVGDNSLRVKHRSFRFTPEDQPGGATIKFRGKFNKKGKKATGTYRAQGDFSIDGVIAHNCDTGTVEWSARKQPSTN